jgi:hypothetical protein
MPDLTAIARTVARSYLDEMRGASAIDICEIVDLDLTDEQVDQISDHLAHLHGYLDATIDDWSPR